jgi:hypothetical protein
MWPLVCLVALTVSPVAAQEPPRLLFEISVDGKVVARPELRVPLGGEGRLSFDKDPYLMDIIFTLTLRGDDVALAFTITSRGQEVRPVIQLSRTLQATLELPPPTGAQTFRIVVSWIQ